MTIKPKKLNMDHKKLLFSQPFKLGVKIFSPRVLGVLISLLREVDTSSFGLVITTRFGTLISVLIFCVEITIILAP